MERVKTAKTRCFRDWTFGDRLVQQRIADLKRQAQPEFTPTSKFVDTVDHVSSYANAGREVVLVSLRHAELPIHLEVQSNEKR